MDKWIRILYAAWFLVFTVVPFLYKSSRQSMLRFYDRMVWLYSARRLYSLMVFLSLVVFHFYHLTVFRCHYDVIPSTAVVYALCSHRIFERTIRFLQNQRTLWATMIISALMLFIPHFFTLGVTFGVLVLAAVFYPSLIVLDKRHDNEWWELALEDASLLPELYHRWDLMEGSKLADSTEACPANKQQEAGSADSPGKGGPAR